jgi:type IV secretory pathway VirB4 component
VAIAKMESTLNMQIESGSVPSADLKVRIKDTEELMERLASGKDRIIETSFYITISADSLDKLNTISHEAESVFRQIELTVRRARKQMNKAIKSMLPICNDALMEIYTFDTKSLSTLVPFTARNFTNGGILYGISEESSELITIDRYAMPNPNKIILGSSGYGKSMLAKVVDISREMVNQTQIIVIDHNYEYKKICETMGGQYVEEGDAPNWNNQMLVFGGNKTKALRTIWKHITTTSFRKRGLIIDEFHNILHEDAELILTVIREIRKYYTAPTLITQNIIEFLRSDQGKMIMDLCATKILMRQGDNDLEEVTKLFDLSKYERLYLKTCDKGYGYIFTSGYKTKLKVVYSEKEEQILTTDPRRRAGS